MQAEIITIGDEILIGQIVDTNSAWMARKLNKIGVKVKQISSVSDDREHILAAFEEAKSRVDLILITGGLGPTKDDITKKTLCEYFKCGTVFNEDQFKVIEAIFNRYSREVTAINRKQAEVPELCTCIVNHNGTAPAMWFDVDGKVFVSMPGVPYEMQGIMETSVLPMIRERFNTPVIQHRTFLTHGVGESMLASWIENWEDGLPPNMKLAYLPASGQVRLRISATGSNSDKLSQQIDAEARKLYALIGEHIFGEGELTMEECVQNLMLEAGKTLSVAESCTGGYLGHLITGLSGSSAYFKGGAITYSEELKIKLLGVNPNTIASKGVVSEEVALEMAQGALREFDSDYALSVTGIAGPSGGTDELKVGSIWIGIAGLGLNEAKLFHFGQNRERNIRMGSLTALNLLRKALIAHQSNKATE